ncbi:MAG: hypothetical protein JEY96_19425 [Bacteroidales bacterium]|nr:hypothetical protein [Bacteroidales bacterium]
MKIESIFSVFMDKVSQVEMVKNSMNTFSKSELERLHIQKKNIDANPEIKEIIGRMDFFHIEEIDSGELLRYDIHESFTAEMIEKVFLYKNKQYQWLLAESFELFKDYLEEIYALIGYLSYENWPLKDFGNIYLEELKKKKYDYFLSQAKIKKDSFNSILNKLREIFPNYKDNEVDNKLGKNIKMYLALIEIFRHVIVHLGGKVKDRDLIVEKILKKSGYWNNGNANDEYVKFILSFFGANEEANTIMLVEIPVVGRLPIPAEFSRIDDLFNSIKSSAHALYKEMKQFEEKNTNA